MSSSLAYVPGGGRTRLTMQQITGFWAAWAGWMLDGMDSFIYALVLAPAMRELLPKSGYAAGPADVAYAGSLLFGLFLVGWGLSFIWGPIADRFGRTRTLAGTVVIYSVFTGAAALAENVWQLGLFRFLAGIGIGGEWAMAGTYVAEAWPEDRRRQGAGYLQTGYYAGFFVAAVLNFTVGASLGWRAMFLCGLAPVVVSIVTLLRVKEPATWQQAHASAPRRSPLAIILSGALLRRTLVNTTLVAVAIIGLWAGAVYEPTAVIKLAIAAGQTPQSAARTASYATGLLSIGTILGCLVLPSLADRLGRRWTLGGYFAGMAVTIAASFGWAFYLPAATALPVFMTTLFFLGVFGGNFALFSLWLPEQYATSVRATAFAFCTSIGRFVGAGVNFALAAEVKAMGTLGVPVALTAIAFGLGLLVIPLAVETRGQTLPA
jgi:MFS family permease